MNPPSWFTGKRAQAPPPPNDRLFFRVEPGAIQVAARCEKGRRESNQDYVLAATVSGSTLLIVCDGVGGGLAGDDASKAAARTILNELVSNDGATTHVERLETAVQKANEAVRNCATRNGLINPDGRSRMETTLVVALINNKPNDRGGHTVTIANVGNSRAVIMNASEPSWQHATILHHKPTQRNMLTRSIGGRPAVYPDVISDILYPEDTLLLSSICLHGQVNEEDIYTIASAMGSTLDEIAESLAISSDFYASQDNLGVLVARVQPGGTDRKETRGIPPPDDTFKPIKKARHTVPDPMTHRLAAGLVLTATEELEHFRVIRKIAGEIGVDYLDKAGDPRSDRDLRNLTASELMRGGEDPVDPEVDELARQLMPDFAPATRRTRPGVSSRIKLEEDLDYVEDAAARGARKGVVQGIIDTVKKYW